MVALLRLGSTPEAASQQQGSERDGGAVWVRELARFGSLGAGRPSVSHPFSESVPSIATTPTDTNPASAQSANTSTNASASAAGACQAG
jgi:hypothetical protein